MRDIILWFILLFNRNKTYFDMRQTNYSLWLTGKGEKLRINYTDPLGGGSFPVRKVGLFKYEGYIGENRRIFNVIDEINLFCSPVWGRFFKSPWTLGAEKTIR